jgi:hypothetical protein
MTTPAEDFIARILDKVARGDTADPRDWIAPGAKLFTPRHHKPITDPMHFAIILRSIPKVLENFRYDRTWASGDEAIMEFKGNIGAVEVHGLDIFTVGADGKVTELTVFARPTKAHAALAEREDALVIETMQKIQAGEPVFG